MKKIIITLQITDQETVADYAENNQEIFIEDITHGSLGELCELIDVKIEE